MDRGKFIVLEGINSCGKTVHQNLLVNRCMKEFPGRNFITTSEPTHDLPIGKALREYYLPGKRKADNCLLTHLYALDRYDQIANQDYGSLVRINNGCNIIQSRNYISSLAMEGAINGIPGIESVYEINRMSIDLLKPDIIIVIEKDLEYVIEYHNDKDECDIFELEDKLIQTFRGYQMAIKFLRENTDENIVRINGNDPVEKTHENIWKIVRDLF